MRITQQTQQSFFPVREHPHLISAVVMLYFCLNLGRAYCAGVAVRLTRVSYSSSRQGTLQEHFALAGTKHNGPIDYQEIQSDNNFLNIH